MRKDYDVVAVFREAPRLRKGSIVWVAGHPVGKVVDVALLPPTRDTMAPRVAAMLELSFDAQPLLRRDSQLRLTAARLMAEPVVEIDPGSAGAPILREGDTIRALPAPPKTEFLIAEAKQTQASLDTLMRESHGLLARFDTRSAQMALVNRQASLASAELAKLENEIQNGPLTDFMNDERQSDAIARIQGNAAAITDALQEAQERASKAMRETEPARKRLSRHIAELQQQLATLQKMLDNPNGSYGRMQRDSALMKAVHGAQAQLDSLMTESKKNPLRYWF